MVYRCSFKPVMVFVDPGIINPVVTGGGFRSSAIVAEGVEMAQTSALSALTLVWLLR